MKTCKVQNSLFLTDNKQSKKSEGKFCEISINCEVELPDRDCDLNEGDYFLFTYLFFWIFIPNEPFGELSPLVLIF